MRHSGITRERLVVGLVSINMAFLGWCFGGFPVKALWVYFGIGAAVFLSLFVPMGDGFRGVRGNVVRLLKFPIFWLGGLFLCYIVLQGMNPAWEIVRNENSWWLEQVDHRVGWPTSVLSPFEEINAFRVLVVMSTALMMVCGLWVGVKRRKSLLFILWVFGVNGFFYALVGIALKLIKAKKVLGYVEWETGVFFGSFFYRNHGAAYLYIVMSVLMGLSLYYFLRSWKRMERSGPHVLLSLMIMTVGLGFVFALSRGGVLGAGLVGGLFILGLVRALYKVYGVKVGVVVLLVLMGLVYGAGEWMYSSKDLAAVEKRFEEGDEGLFSGRSMDLRYLLMEATYDMYLDNRVWGWGAGSFRYSFPIYRVHYHILEYAAKGKHAHYHYAHTDMMQFLAEYGIVGCSLLLGILLYVVLASVWYWRGMNSLVFLIYGGGVVLMLHSVIDFMMQSPSIWITFCVLMVLGLRMMKLGHQSRMGSR